MHLHLKPGKIAVQYTYDYQALRPYEQLVSSHAGHSFSVRLEPAGDRMNLALICEEDGGRTVYRDLHYRKEQVLRLDAWFNSAEPGIFVHVYARHNQLLVARPFRQQQFLKVVRVELVSPENFT